MEKQWIKNAKQTDYSFAPPRDPDFKVTHKKRDGDTYDEYGILKQMPLVLICKKGHISDIPWELFFGHPLIPVLMYTKRALTLEAMQHIVVDALSVMADHIS